MRVFQDRLISKEDILFVEEEAFKLVVERQFGKETLPQLVKITEYKETEIQGEKSVEKTRTEESNFYFTDFMSRNLYDEESDDPKLLEEMDSLEKIREKVSEFLSVYNEENQGQEMNLVLFKEMLEHLLRLLRIVGFPKGHA